VQLPVFPHVEYPQDKDIGIRYLITDLIVADHDSTYFPRLKFPKTRSQSRVRWNTLHSHYDLSNNANGGRDVTGMKEFVEADQIGAGASCPPQGHNYRRLRAFGFERPAAQASISA
jgi:hypothetical protein